MAILSLRSRIAIQNGDDYDLSPFILKGTYQPPLGVFGAAFDAVVGHRIAQMTARSLIATIADSIASLAPQQDTAPAKLRCVSKSIPRQYNSGRNERRRRCMPANEIPVSERPQTIKDEITSAAYLIVIAGSTRPSLRCGDERAATPPGSPSAATPGTGLPRHGTASLLGSRHQRPSSIALIEGRCDSTT